MVQALALSLIVLSGAVTSVAGAGLPSPVVKTGFLTPSGNIACNAGPAQSGRPAILCTVFSSAGPRGQRVWGMYDRGRVSVGWIQGNASTEFPKLGYGRVWSWRGITCRSQLRGVTCRNRARHGFFLSRQKQRVF